MPPPVGPGTELKVENLGAALAPVPVELRGRPPNELRLRLGAGFGLHPVVGDAGPAPVASVSASVSAAPEQEPSKGGKRSLFGGFRKTKNLAKEASEKGATTAAANDEAAAKEESASSNADPFVLIWLEGKGIPELPPEQKQGREAVAARAVRAALERKSRVVEDQLDPVWQQEFSINLVPLHDRLAAIATDSRDHVPDALAASKLLDITKVGSGPGAGSGAGPSIGPMLLSQYLLFFSL